MARRDDPWLVNNTRVTISYKKEPSLDEATKLRNALVNDGNIVYQFTRYYDDVLGYVWLIMYGRPEGKPINEE